MKVRLLISSSLVFAASFISFWSSLGGEFVFDDHRGVLTNDDLDPSKTSLWDIFQHDFWGGPMSRKESHKSYRPLTVITYRYLNFYNSGLDPYGYHLVNVAFHSIASLLVLALYRCILGESCSPVGAGGWIRLEWSTYAALLFAVHSIHTEAVASIVGRAEALSCIFFLLSILSYCKATSKGCGQSLSPLTRTSWSLIFASILFSLCAMLSKEQGIVSVGVCAVFDVILHWEMFWDVFFRLLKANHTVATPGTVRDGEGNSEDTAVEQVLLKDNIGGVLEQCNGLNGLVGGASNGKRTKPKRKQHLNAELSDLAKRLGLLVVSGMAMAWFRLSMNYNSQPIFKEEELKAVFHPDRSVRIMSFSNIYTINAWLLLSPSSLCCDWSLGSIPLVTSIADPRNIWATLLYSAVGLLVVRVLRSDRDLMSTGMGVALTMLTFLPASGLIFRVGFVIAERVLYMPSIGLCLLVVIGARRITHTLQHKLLKMALHCILVSLVIIMAAKTHTRNKDWATDFALFESGVRVNPQNVKLRNNYGIELKSAGRVEEALHQYQQSLATDPDFGEVYLNIGNLLSDEKKYAEALIYFEKAIEFPQMYHKTLNNLATTYFRLGHLQEAEVRFHESIQRNPDQPMTYNNLASLYGEMKRYKESEKMFRKALKLNPQYTEAYFNLGTLFIQMMELDKGEKYLRKALELHPHHPGALNNLRVIDHYRKNENT